MHMHLESAAQRHRRAHIQAFSGIGQMPESANRESHSPNVILMLSFNNAMDTQRSRRVGRMAAGLCASWERAEILTGADLSHPDTLALTPAANHIFADASLLQIEI